LRDTYYAALPRLLLARELSASGNGETAKQYLTGSNAQNLLLFDAPLNRWLKSLPPYLRVSDDGDESSERSPEGSKRPYDEGTVTKATFKQQANILYAQ
jgi:hypothetical protein